MGPWLEGLHAVLTWECFLYAVLGCIIGIVVGAIPGFSATMGVAVALPFTFAVDAVPGLVLLLAIYGSALYAGAIPAILLNVPGTPGAAATLLDGHPMAKSGRAGKALTISLGSATFGGFIGVILVGIFAPLFAEFATSFGSADYFMLSLFALAIIASLSEGAMIRGLISGGLGLLISFIGVDPIDAFPRFTFGVEQLAAGASFIPVLIGLFGVSEALKHYEATSKLSIATASIGSYKVSGKEWRFLAPTSVLSSVIGFVVGVLPGTGGTAASFIAYDQTKHLSKKNKRFGKGDPRGVAATEASNHGSIAGALVPMLTLGIPGDANTAILIGAITVHGLRPGPQLFSGNPDLVYGMFVALVLTYLVTLALGLAGIRMWAQVLKVPPNILWPVVIVLCVVGSYALRFSITDVMVMLVVGVLGYLMLKARIPIIPLVVGVVLGPIAESGLRRALVVSGGSFDWILEPVPFVLLLLTIASLLLPVFRYLRSRSRAGTETGIDADNGREASDDTDPSAKRATRVEAGTDAESELSASPRSEHEQ